MVKEIGIFEAKTNFSQVMEACEKGADYIVTRRGKPVAKIIPFAEEPQMTRREALDKLIEFRKSYRGKPGSFNIKEAINEGRP
jgi:prevent-host-death family protein